MAAVKKTKLYSSLWASCDELRGGMDASQYKDYILTLLFVKYVSDKDKHKDGDVDIEIPKGGSFDDIIALKGNKNIGEEIDKIIAKIAEANDLRGVIDKAKFNDSSKLGSGKEMVDKLTNIVAIFQESGLDFKNNRADDDDIIGDAYEYLMRHFAAEVGKNKGSFYTPSEVSRILAKLVGISKINSKSDITLYDPACGSGSLLVKVAEEARNIDKVAAYGQELDGTTAGLAKMNFVLHNLATADVKGGFSTFSKPQYWEEDKVNRELKRFDFIVANPPFSTKNWTNGYVDYDRTKDYISPPNKNGDYAWVLHILKSLKSTGKAAVILPHGVLFRGNAEATIRKAIIDKGYIKGIIGLPANLFYGTGIPACIVLLDKENALERTGIFMIDASRGFTKDGNKNRLRERDVYKIVKHFEYQITEERFSRFVPNREIKTKNNYNLNISRYIDGYEPEDQQNIDAHLNGGIPQDDINALGIYWDAFDGLKDKLFTVLREGFYKPQIEKDLIKQTIYADEKFASYSQKIDVAFDKWHKFAKTTLLAITDTTNVKQLIISLAEKLVDEYKDILLVDKYDVYEVLLAYWNEVMADDVYLIKSGGFAVARELDLEYEKKGSVIKEKSWDGKILPKQLVAKYFFKDKVDAIIEVEVVLETTIAKLDELADEHSCDDGILSDAKTDKGTISIDTIKKVLKETTDESDLEILNTYLELDTQVKEQRRLLKQMQTVLWEDVRTKYAKLTDNEIKDILLNKKWFNVIYEGIDKLYSDISSKITSSIITLIDRYEETLPSLEANVKDLENKVKSHLKRMGFEWWK